MNISRILTLAVAAASITAAAAAPRALSVDKGAFHPVLSPDGTTLLFSTEDHTGLKALDMTSGDVTVIDEAASAGFQPVFTADGSRVLYRTASTREGLLYRDVRAYDFAEKAVSTLEAPSRSRAHVATMADATYALADFSTIEVSLDGKVSRVSPVEDAYSYQWASLSPDCSKLAFTEPFKGVYVSAADGSAARNILPKGDYVSWAGPSTIIAVVSHDDGYVLLDSRLVAVNINTGIVSYLTPEDVLVSEATAAPNGLVVYSDVNGKLFSIDINAL